MGPQRIFIRVSIAILALESAESNASEFPVTSGKSFDGARLKHGIHPVRNRN